MAPYATIFGEDVLVKSATRFFMSDDRIIFLQPSSKKAKPKPSQQSQRNMLVHSLWY